MLIIVSNIVYTDRAAISSGAPVSMTFRKTEWDGLSNFQLEIMIDRHIKKLTGYDVDSIHFDVEHESIPDMDNLERTQNHLDALGM